MDFLPPENFIWRYEIQKKSWQKISQQNFNTFFSHFVASSRFGGFISESLEVFAIFSTRYHLRNVDSRIFFTSLIKCNFVSIRLSMHMRYNHRIGFLAVVLFTSSQLDIYRRHRMFHN